MFWLPPKASLPLSPKRGHLLGSFCVSLPTFSSGNFILLHRSAAMARPEFQISFSSIFFPMYLKQVQTWPPANRAAPEAWKSNPFSSAWTVDFSPSVNTSPFLGFLSSLLLANRQLPSVLQMPPLKVPSFFCISSTCYHPGGNNYLVMGLPCVQSRLSNVFHRSKLLSTQTAQRASYCLSNETETTWPQFKALPGVVPTCASFLLFCFGPGRPLFWQALCLFFHVYT